MKHSIQTCYSPSLYHLFEDPEAIVVVVDVLRATSAICTAIHNGVDNMIPVAHLEEALRYKKQGYLVAAERNAIMQDGCDFGNSPSHYLNNALEGKTVVISTTNGTQAIDAAKDATTTLIGSFLNISTVSAWLKKQNRNVIVLCAGWKNKYNLEDSLFAGALALELLKDSRFFTECDSTISAGYLYDLAKKDLFGFLENSSHRKRLNNLHLEDDILYCLTPDSLNTIPYVTEGLIKKMPADYKLEPRKVLADMKQG